MNRWKVYQRNDELWLGYERDDNGAYRGLVKAHTGNLRGDIQLLGLQLWQFSRRISSPTQVRHVQAIVAKLELVTPFTRRYGAGAHAGAQEFDLPDYLDEHARDMPSAMLTLNALAAKLDEQGCRLNL